MGILETSENYCKVEYYSQHDNFNDSAKIYIRPRHLSAQIFPVMYQFIHSKSQIPPAGLQGPTGSSLWDCSSLPRQTSLLAVHWTFPTPFPPAVPLHGVLFYSRGQPPAASSVVVSVSLPPQSTSDLKLLLEPHSPNLGPLYSDLLFS